MEATGKIIVVFPLTSGKSQRTGNTWYNQEYVLQTEGQYPKKIPFEVFGEDRINQFAIQQGERLTIHFDIDANEYQGKYYPKIRCYNVTRQQAAQPTATHAVQHVAPQPPLFPPEQSGQGEPDDLPF